VFGALELASVLRPNDSLFVLDTRSLTSPSEEKEARENVLDTQGKSYKPHYNFERLHFLPWLYLPSKAKKKFGSVSQTNVVARR